jgi:nucleotide-binding universal stress UspA family protein
VVVGVGESDAGVAALAWASEVCRSRGWLLDVVTAWPDLGEPLIHEVPGHYNGARGRVVAALQAALATCDVEVDGPTVTVHVVNDDPVHALVDLSRGAQLLVLGSSGRGRSRRAGQEPLSEACRRLASCPVLVVGNSASAPGRTA